MNFSRNLQDLIRSLGLAEKNYFRAFAKRRIKDGSASFLQLFDLMDRSNPCDEEKIAAKLGVADFPSMKMRLERMITDVIQERNMRLKPMSRIQSLYQQCIILHQKRLYDLMYKRMDKMQKLCLQMEDYASLRTMMQMKQAIALEGVDPGFIPPVMKGFYDLYPEVKARLRNLEAFSDMEDLIHEARCSRPNQMYDVALALSADPLLAEDAPKPSVREQFKFCELTRLVLRYTNRYFEAEKYSRKIIAAMDSAPHLLQDVVLKHHYLSQIKNIGLNHAARGEFDLARQAIKRLQELATSPVTLFERVHAIELRMALRGLDREGGAKVIQAISEGMNAMGHRMRQLQIIDYSFQIAHFLCLSEPSKALKWILKLQQFTMAGTRVDLRHYAEILFLICHYDLGNYALIPSEARKTRRYLEKMAGLSEFEEAVISGLTLAAKAKGEAARLAKLEELYQQLEVLFENPRLSIKRHYFPLLSWIRAKGSKRSPMEVELEG
jgi:tetratricopeptide (TPR) repeat protein